MFKLHYTGHPFIDVGLATIIEYINSLEETTQKIDHPEELQKKHLEKMATFIKERFYNPPLKSYLTILINNSAFTQKTIGEDKKKAYEKLFSAFEAEPIDKRCTFFNKPAIGIAYRQHIPLLTGEGCFNFCPEGSSGIPVSAEAGLCNLAMMLGTIKCSGRVLLVHSNDEQIMRHYAGENLKTHQKQLSLEFKYPKTIVLEELNKIYKSYKTEKRMNDALFVDVYYFTNYGTSPDIDLYRLPLNQMNFLRVVNQAKYADKWQKIINSAWQLKVTEEGNGKNKVVTKEKVTQEEGIRKNFLYEDFFNLPDNANQFIRKYLFNRKQIDLISWNITEIFLEEVLDMDPEKIKTIKTVADRFAEHIVSNKDKKFFDNFYFKSKSYLALRSILLKKTNNLAKEEKDSIISFDEYVAIFEKEQDSFKEWKLSRDLITLRLIEQIREKDPKMLSNMICEEDEDVEEIEENKVLA